MSDGRARTDKIVNLDRYGSPVLKWSRARDALVTGSPSPSVTFFLGTVGPEGTPHAAGVGGLCQDGRLYFTSSPRMRKARDLAANPRCTISARLPDIDLILEGEATRVTDAPTLERIVGQFREGGWPARSTGWWRCARRPTWLSDSCRDNAGGFLSSS